MPTGFQALGYLLEESKDMVMNQIGSLKELTAQREKQGRMCVTLREEEEEALEQFWSL